MLPLNTCPHCGMRDVLVICHICKQDVTKPGAKSFLYSVAADPQSFTPSDDAGQLDLAIAAIEGTIADLQAFNESEVLSPAADRVLNAMSRLGLLPATPQDEDKANAYADAMIERERLSHPAPAYETAPDGRLLR